MDVSTPRPADDHDITLAAIDQIACTSDFAVMLRRFRDRHTARNRGNELTYRQLASKSGYSVGATFNYLKVGKRPKSAAVVADLLKVFGATPGEIAAMTAAYDRLPAEPRLAGPGREQRHRAGTSIDGTRRGLPRRWLTIGVITMIAAAVAAVGAVVWWPRSPSPGCDAKRTHLHQFPDSFVGAVWVYYTSPSEDASMVDVTLKWAHPTWQETLPLNPGDLDAGQGGTLVTFQKFEATTPEVIFRSSVPVCARFGTEQTRPTPRADTRLEARGWT